MQRAVARIEQPLHHRPCHLGKAGHEVMVRDAEARDAVERIRNDVRPGRKLAQAQSFFGRFRAEAAADFRLGAGVQPARDAQRGGNRLPRVVVRRDTDAATGEHDVGRRHRTTERVGQPLRLVAQIAHPGQLQAALGEQRAHLREVPVLTTSGQDFVADDVQTDAHAEVLLHYW